MKILLIILFISLVSYLIIHMCGGFSSRRKKSVRPVNDVNKRFILLDNLASLKDRDLSLLRDEIQDLKELLGKNNSSGGPEKKDGFLQVNRTINHHRDYTPDQSKLSSKALLQKIEREAQTGIPHESDKKRSSGFIPKIIVVNVLLILITLLVMLI